MSVRLRVKPSHNLAIRLRQYQQPLTVRITCWIFVPLKAVPTAFNGTNIQQVINITATIDGRDETFTDIPFNVEVAQSGDKIFSGSRDAMISVVDNLINQSKKALNEVEYHRTMISEGDKILEVLNPKYAEEKKQAKTINELQQGYSSLNKKFDKIESDNGKIMSMLTELLGKKSAKN